MLTRREVLQRTTVLLGYSLTGSAIAGVLAGCRATPGLDWTPGFLTPDEARLVGDMADFLLPATGTPGARDLHVDRFLDAMLKDYSTKDEQAAFRKGLADFEAECRTSHGGPFANLDAEARRRAFQQQESQAPPVPPTIWGGQISAVVPPLAFYRHFKQLAMLGYFMSEQVGKHILTYDAVPGRFDGCIPVSDVGNAWSL